MNKLNIKRKKEKGWKNEGKKVLFYQPHSIGQGSKCWPGLILLGWVISRTTTEMILSSNTRFPIATMNLAGTVESWLSCDENYWFMTKLHHVAEILKGSKSCEFCDFILFSYLARLYVLPFAYIPHGSCLWEIDAICILKLNMKTVLLTFTLNLFLLMSPTNFHVAFAWSCIFRYDGQRAQIHKLVNGSMRIFSRNGDEMTARFPDLVSVIRESCKPDALTFILDAEVSPFIMRSYFIEYWIFFLAGDLKNLY